MARTGKHQMVKMASRAQASRPRRQYVKKMPKERTPTKAWSKKEDVALKELVAAASEEDLNKWISIAGGMIGRSGKQCRERWMNHLRPGIKKGDWKVNEDRMIMTLQKNIGNRWTKIAEHLPGRTDNDVKNRWHSNVRSLKKKGVKTMAELIKKREEELTRNMKNTSTNARHEASGAATKCIAIKNVFYETPAKKLPGMPMTKCADSSDSVFVASTLSAMKRSLFSPFDESAGKNEESSSTGRPSGIDFVPPLSASFHPSNPVHANDIFSPSFHPRSMAMTTPTPAMPLATISSCHSGPFILNTPLFKVENVDGTKAVTERKSPSDDDEKEYGNENASLFGETVDITKAVTEGKSPREGDIENGLDSVGMTPLPYHHYKSSFGFTLKSPCPRTYAV